MEARGAERRRSLAVAFAGFCAFLGLYVTQPLLPMFEHLFRAGKSTVSLTLTASTLGVAIAAPLVGSVADRLGRKRVIVGSAGLLTLATLLSATSTAMEIAATPGLGRITDFARRQAARESAHAMSDLRSAVNSAGN